MTSKGESNTFTARDMELLAGVLKCLKTELAVDYPKYAACFGFKNANSAKASWHTLRKKLDKMADGGSVEPSLTITPAETPAGVPNNTGKKRKGKDDEDDAEEPESTSTGIKSKKRGKKAPFGMEMGEKVAKQDDDEEMPADASDRKGNVKDESADES